LAPLAWHEIGDDGVVWRQREVRDGRICAREMVLSKAHGMIRDRTYRLRPYTPEDLSALVARAGFGDIARYRDASALPWAEDGSCMNQRLVLSARKP
jgi:hypothetical protein